MRRVKKGMSKRKGRREEWERGDDDDDNEEEEESGCDSKEILDRPVRFF
jgi:hypothetical protein